MIATPRRERRAQVRRCRAPDRPAAGSRGARARGRDRERASRASRASSLTPREEHGLVHHRKAGVGEARRTRAIDSRRELLRVIEVRHHPERMVRAERAHELARDAHRERHRDARREADRLDAGDRADRARRGARADRCHRERIAAAHDDVADLGVRARSTRTRARARSSETAPPPSPTMRERVQKRQ